VASIRCQRRRGLREFIR